MVIAGLKASGAAYIISVRSAVLLSLRLILEQLEGVVPFAKISPFFLVNPFLFSFFLFFNFPFFKKSFKNIFPFQKSGLFLPLFLCIETLLKQLFSKPFGFQG